MAKATLTIPDEYAALLVQAICKNYGYRATITNPMTGEVCANPETAQAFAIRKRIEYNKDQLKAFLVPDLAQTDRAAKIAEIDAINITLMPEE